MDAGRLVTISRSGNQVIRAARPPSSAGSPRVDRAACRAGRVCGSVAPLVGGGELASHGQPSGRNREPLHTRGRQNPHAAEWEPSCTGESPRKHCAGPGAGDGVGGGRISRATGTETRFGRQADFLADTALWTWFTIRHEHNRSPRAATLAVWGFTVVAITTVSFAGGGMRDIPRSRWIRPVAALQVILGFRIVLRQTSSSRRR